MNKELYDVYGLLGYLIGKSQFNINDMPQVVTGLEFLAKARQQYEKETSASPDSDSSGAQDTGSPE